MIREATSSDFDAIAALEKQVFIMHFESRPDIINKNPFNQEYYDKCLEDEHMKMFVFEENGSIIGYCKTVTQHYEEHPVFNDMTVLEINSMCVDEKARGKHVGRRLFDKAKAYAQEIKAARLELTVWNFNKNAREFYEHLGMTTRTLRMELGIE